MDENENFVQEMDDDSYEDDFEKKVNEKIEVLPDYVSFLAAQEGHRGERVQPARKQVQPA